MSSLTTRRKTRTVGTVALVLGLAGGAVAGIGLAPSPAGATTASAAGPSTTIVTTGTGIYTKAAQLTGPVTGGHIVEPLSANPTGLSAHGYTEQEYFASGTASAFRATASPADGRWTIVPTTSAFYRTRILVRRPIDPAHFSGTVVVEWMNVSDGESAPDWDYLNPGLMDAGDAYVAVSAQALGVDGGTAILGSGPTSGLVHEEPSRYGTLVHPGDQYALDMFAQIGRALRAPHPAALGGLHPTHVVAAGESQSAFYLTTFADALQPHTHTFAGIFIHSRGGSGAPLSGSSVRSATSGAVRIRTDLGIPVFMFETQTDLIALGYAAAQQPNTDRIRTWEVAGTSHADAYEVGPALSYLGCTTPINNGPQHEVVQAAFRAFTQWVVHGTPPPSPLPFTLSSTHPATLALDSHGNVIGGVRTPDVDVPVSTLSGAAPPGTSELCSLFGQSTPFSAATLTSLYHTKAQYLSEYRASLDQAIAKKYILPTSRAEMLAQADQVSITPAS